MFNGNKISRGWGQGWTSIGFWRPLLGLNHVGKEKQGVEEHDGRKGQGKQRVEGQGG